MKKYIFSLCALALLLIGAVAVKAAVSNQVGGWAWSSTIGWISFDSTDGNTGTNGLGTSPVTYGVTVNENGAFSGYAWSSHVGWVSFNQVDLTGCTGATPATVSTSTGVVSGWVRVVSGIGRTDGWDGCVKLAESSSGTVFPTGYTDGTRGVTYSGSEKKFKGYGWGSDVLGWVRFDPTLDYLIVDCPTCGGGEQSLRVSCSNPSSVQLNNGSADVTFNAIVTGGTSPYEYKWNSGSYDSVNSYPKTYTQTGTYEVSLAIRDNGGNTDSTTCSVTVTDAGTPPPGSCVPPQNAQICTYPTNVTDPTKRLYTDCPNQVTTKCTFECVTGYELRAGQCVKASIEES